MPPPDDTAEQLVLHIGSGKTGTSTIQHFLWHNRARLAQLGLLVPESPGRRRHVRLGLSIKTDDAMRATPSWSRQPETDPVDLRRNVAEGLSREIGQGRPRTVVLSDEALYGAPPGDLERLAALVRSLAREPRVLVYLRRQDEHLRSRYQQVVKTGGVRRLVERAADDDLHVVYDYQARLAVWRHALPDAVPVVRRFERESFPDGSLTADFLHALGLADAVGSLENVHSSNESLDAESVEFLRLLNLLRVEREGATAGRIDNRQLVERLTAHSSGPTLTLPDDELDRFMARWERSNRAVAREYLGEPDGVLFRTARRGEGTTTEQRLDPSRVDHFLDVVRLPTAWREPLVALARREAGAG